MIFNIGFLEQIKKETSETIVKIRSNTDAAENQRRMQEERTKKDRYVFFRRIMGYRGAKI
jgi:hypothetical protein